MNKMPLVLAVALLNCASPRARPQTEHEASPVPQGQNVAPRSSSNASPMPHRRTESKANSPFDYLMAPDLRRAAASCGYGDLPTTEWIQLHSLIEAGDTEQLEILAASAPTREGRVLGIIGLLRAGLASREETVKRLADMDGKVNTCGGCLIYKMQASHLIHLAEAPDVPVAEMLRERDEFLKEFERPEEETAKAAGGKAPP